MSFSCHLIFSLIFTETHLLFLCHTNTTQTVGKNRAENQSFVHIWSLKCFNPRYQLVDFPSNEPPILSTLSNFLHLISSAQTVEMYVCRHAFPISASDFINHPEVQEAKVTQTEPLLISHLSETK